MRAKVRRGENQDNFSGTLQAGIVNLLKDATLAVEPRLGVPYSGFLSREKTSGFPVSVAIREFSPRKSIFKQFVKVFSRERNPLYGSSRVIRLGQTTKKAMIAENCSLVQA